MVNASIRTASNAATRLACSMPRVGSRAALGALAVEQRQEAEAAPRRLERQNSVERAPPYVASSPAPSGGVMLMEAISSLVAAVPSKGAAGLRIDAFIAAIDRGTLHVLRALGPCALLAVKNGVDNLSKIRTATEAAAAAGVKCTYVHELLDFEVARGAHKLGTASDGSGAVLGNPSGAIAVLWIRRLLEFSAAVLQRVLEGSTIDVAMEQAYADMLRPFHGWMLRKVVWDSLVPGCATEDQSFKAVLAAIPPYVDASGRIVAHVTSSFRARCLEDKREA